MSMVVRLHEQYNEMGWDTGPRCQQMEVGVRGATGAPVTWTAAGTGAGSVPTPAPSTGAQTAPATPPRRRAAAGTLAVVTRQEYLL